MRRKGLPDINSKAIADSVSDIEDKSIGSLINFAADAWLKFFSAKNVHDGIVGSTKKLLKTTIMKAIGVAPGNLLEKKPNNSLIKIDMHINGDTAAKENLALKKTRAKLLKHLDCDWSGHCSSRNLDRVRMLCYLR